ncbi:MAG: 1-deoxy-D-xylulose-5-phosphate reductoisomerase, partial [Pseudohongiellaceae bacterium]
MLGSTGSIGVNTLDVLRQHRDRYKVFALTANNSVDVLRTQCIEFEPEIAVMKDEVSADRLALDLKNAGSRTQVQSGDAALVNVARDSRSQIVMAAIVGGAGLAPTIAAAESGKRVLLANKESLVMAGGLFMQAVADNGAILLPIDSEHNAIFQCLANGHSAYATGV